MHEITRTPSRPPQSKNASSQNNLADPENMRVIIRLRPPLQPLLRVSERSAGSFHDSLPRLRPVALSDDPLECPYTLQPEQASILAGGSWYTFDGVHAPSSPTSEIYEAHVASMIRDAVSGYNSTLFAYGATGSGKSHSMIGNHRELGIVPRAIDDVFDLIEQDEEREYVIRASYLEIYNEQLRDLLADEPAATSNLIPKIHEDRQGRIFVRPLVATPCAEPEDVMDLLIMGESRRKTESTEWNCRSSRSHAILSLTIESRPVIGATGFPITSSAMREATSNGLSRQHLSPVPPVESTSDDGESEMFLGTGPGKLPVTPSVARFKSASSSRSGHPPDGSIRISQLNLVDLAGSEKLTDNEARNKEAGYIKKSLLALQNVVSSLTELSSSTSSNSNTHKHRLLHIPYRNSQLTRLLQTSLSGNAKVAFLCTISPDPDCEVETLSTLRFAAGAKKVVTKAELGQVVDRATLLQALESKVLELEAALLTNADYTEALERERDEAIERADGAVKTCDDYEAKLAELQTLRTPLKEQHDHLRRLILTGSPRSSYANQTSVDPNNSAGLSPTTCHRRKSTVKRPSRLSEGTSLTSPAKKVGWKELLFGDSQTAAEHTNGAARSNENVAPTAEVTDLQLTIDKLEATMAEAEETHAGEVSELRAEIDALHARISSLESQLDGGDECHSPELSDLKQAHEAEVKTIVSNIEAQLETEKAQLAAELFSEQESHTETRKLLQQSEDRATRLAKEVHLLRQAQKGDEKRLQTRMRALEDELGRLRVGGEVENRRCSEVTLDGDEEEEEHNDLVNTQRRSRSITFEEETPKENEDSGQVASTTIVNKTSRKQSTSRSKKQTSPSSANGTQVRRSTRSKASKKVPLEATENHV